MTEEVRTLEEVMTEVKSRLEQRHSISLEETGAKKAIREWGKDRALMRELYNRTLDLVQDLEKLAYENVDYAENNHD